MKQKVAENPLHVPRKSFLGAAILAAGLALIPACHSPVPPLSQRAAVQVAGNTPSIRAPAGAHLRIGMIGDSLTAGRYPDELRSILKDRFSRLAFERYGGAGFGIDRLSSLFETKILGSATPYDVLILQGGLNDIASGAAAVEENLKLLIGCARDRGILVVVLTTTPWANSHSWSAEGQRQSNALNDWILNQAREGVVAVDLSSLGAGMPPVLRTEFDFGDHGHLNSEGAREVARLIARQAFGIGVPEAEKPGA
jgi:lysophospholipase L1-like esterase